MTPPVLLVHGFASSFQLNWKEPGFADLLADAGREVIAVDLPGHGTSARSHDPADYADLPGAVEAALPEAQVDAVGFSLGASTLLRLAVRRPDRFRRIVLAGIGASAFSGGGSDALADVLEAGRAPDDDVLGNLFVQFSQAPGNDPLALAACMRRPQEPLSPEQVGTVTNPVLVVLGDKDHAGPAEPLVEALPNAELVVLRNTEHFATPRSFAFWDAALHFLDDFLDAP